MRAAVDPFGVILSPEVLDAVHAVAVPTGDGDRILWQIETHGAVKLLLRPQLATHNDAVERNKKKKIKDDFQWSAETPQKTPSSWVTNKSEAKEAECHLDSQEEDVESQVREEKSRKKMGGARATRQVEQVEQVLLENCWMPVQ